MLNKEQEECLMDTQQMSGDFLSSNKWVSDFVAIDGFDFDILGDSILKKVRSGKK